MFTERDGESLSNYNGPRGPRVSTDAIFDFFCACDIKVLPAHTDLSAQRGIAKHTHLRFTISDAAQHTGRHTAQTRQGVRNPRPRACFTAGISTAADIRRPASIRTASVTRRRRPCRARANAAAAVLSGSRATGTAAEGVPPTRAHDCAVASAAVCSVASAAGRAAASTSRLAQAWLMAVGRVYGPYLYTGAEDARTSARK
jgi:hypothetical protein